MSRRGGQSLQHGGNPGYRCRQDLSVSHLCLCWHLCLLQDKLWKLPTTSILYISSFAVGWGKCYGPQSNPGKMTHCTCLGLRPVLGQAVIVGTGEHWWPGNRVTVYRILTPVVPRWVWGGMRVVSWAFKTEGWLCIE